MKINLKIENLFKREIIRCNDEEWRDELKWKNMKIIEELWANNEEILSKKKDNCVLNAIKNIWEWFYEMRNVYIKLIINIKKRVIKKKIEIATNSKRIRNFCLIFVFKL